MSLETDYRELFIRLTKRYGSIEPDALESVLCPVLVPIHTLDKTIKRDKGYSASFTVRVDEHNLELLHRGRTGKFVPQSYVAGGIWNEIAKGRILETDLDAGLAYGEVYTGESSKAALEAALARLTDQDYLEIDRYGIAAKLLSGLSEYYIARIAREQGYDVVRMSEDMARHLGAYNYYDFQFRRDGEMRRVEVKSLWGTNTSRARLIHGKGGDKYPTSSCRFDTQDIFAVNLFLRTGNIEDFAFARSVAVCPDNPNGLPAVPKYPEHVTQNPVCQVDNVTWFSQIKDVW
ncbi:MAG TPA: hypothetical protein VEX70_10565 [Pyrinomonadaceae bacterium]|nr:hypothetical protein [Pyrinomonadaceae bacterium]